MAGQAVILSIKPKYAAQIFQGKKTVELRRVCPKLRPGDLVVIYVSSPVKALSGAFKVERIFEAPADELWGIVNIKAGICRKEFDDYFRGSRKAFAIEFREVWRLTKPIELNSLRNIWPGFRPPQNYYYMRESSLTMSSQHLTNYLKSADTVIQ